ncbi:MAG: helix-turn-helix transcriptional regulator [Nocardioides sp.]|uniref:helix-turn-helix transcriptional regulator n=1 Tax=Nocardioides sp. TaxID=35761 RepID=UPI003F05E5C4
MTPPRPTHEGRRTAARRLRVPDDVLVHLRRARDHIDVHHAEPMDLPAMASVAGISTFHFQRLFSATYGVSPSAYLSARRVARAQDLLRTTNLTVTEVCHGVGFTSLGSFSARFTEITGETPSAYQARWARQGAPRIPGCWVFMAGLAERARDVANEEKPARPGTA